MKNVYLILLVFFFACASEKVRTDEQTKDEVWQTVLSHNSAWSELESLAELQSYIDENIVSFSPPFKEPKYGKKAYLEGYQDWFNHAKVVFFNENDPHIQLYLNGTMAIVTFEIEMEFVYDGKKNADWKGRDVMTLKLENNKWLLVSDLFVKYEKE